MRIPVVYGTFACQPARPSRSGRSSVVVVPSTESPLPGDVDRLLPFQVSFLMLNLTRFRRAALCAALLALAACTEKPATNAAATGTSVGRKRIAVIPKGTTHEFWKAVHAGAVKAAREANIEVIWKGPVKEDDRDEQIKVVENFLSQGVDGIVLAPLDDRALVPVVSDAKGRHIPVAIIDSAIQTEDYVSFVATDNEKAGGLAAERLGFLLGGKGDVLVLRYAEGSA